MDFLNTTLLAIFIPTFFVVSITPGMCMTLSLSMGISIGVKRTLYMMYGELLGVGIVAGLSAIGVATLMLAYPVVFSVLKYAGGAYLGYLGIQMWLSRGRMSLCTDQCAFNTSAKSLALQGFLTAIANPKGWAFFIALLPPFLDDRIALAPQLLVLIVLILMIEFLCLIIYASSGKLLRTLLQDSTNLQLLNRISGSMMIGIGIWLALS